MHHQTHKYTLKHHASIYVEISIIIRLSFLTKLPMCLSDKETMIIIVPPPD